ncbi:Rv3235 family protein [Actinomycetospora atypica]|uniref:Rv3235 family protein n=1 Tax=Actinomycetospora atypica TaxID=1290095 RepID=A0ABV9YIJ5_9PSEU
MTLAPGDAGPAPAGGGTDRTPPAVGVRPRERGRTRPGLARRMDRRPPPRVRPLVEDLVERAARPVDEAPPLARAEASTPAWEAALAGARSQVGPVALRVLAAVAEVLDGRRPPEHLGRICPPAVVDRVRVAATGAGLPRGARVRGLRMCPVLAPVPGGTPVLAVEVAAALCAPVPDDRPGPPPRARAVAARFELATDRTTWRLTELLVV